ncbi:MAG: SprT family zinc-dependent metalloprotease [Pseudomonadota bacterium]
MFKPLLTRGARPRLVASLPPLQMPTLVKVRGEQRRLKVRRHAQARRMILRFDPRTGEGKLTVPPGTAASAAIAFLSQSAAWIDANAPELPSSGERYPQSLSLRGRLYRIVPTGKTRGYVEMIEGDVLEVPGAPHRVMPRLAQFLRKEAEAELTPLAVTLAAKIGKRPSALRFRDPRSQWGSCSSARVITLSWRVMMADDLARHYLVAHEVAHLAEMNHGPRFWQTVAQLDPNWKAGKRALKRVEKELLSIHFG